MGLFFSIFVVVVDRILRAQCRVVDGQIQEAARNATHVIVEWQLAEL
jgi:hypothetical protein